MDDRRHIHVDASKALRAFGRVQTSIGKHVTVAMRENGQSFVSAMTLGIKERFKGRTGSLSRAPGYQVTGEGLGSTLRVFMAGVNPKIVRAQEDGGTFRSTRPGGKLTIPIDDNVTDAGQARLSGDVPSGRSPAQLAIDRGAFILRLTGNSRGVRAAQLRSARRLGIRSRTYSGAAYIVFREPNGELKFLFKLVSSVTLKPRLKFRETWDKQRADRASNLRGAVNAGLAEAFRG